MGRLELGLLNFKFPWNLCLVSWFLTSNVDNASLISPV